MNPSESDGRFRVEALRPAHAGALAELHAQTLGGKLTDLGRAFIRRFYETSLQFPDVFGWAAIADGRIMGFVFGSTHGGNVIKRAVVQAPQRWVIPALVGAARRPLRFVRILASHFAPSAGSAPSEAPELLYIAVNREYRGRHVARTLFSRFRAEVARRGAKTFELSVGPENTAAVSFYESEGGEPAREFRAAGATMRRYAFAAQAPAMKEI